MTSIVGDLDMICADANAQQPREIDILWRRDVSWAAIGEALRISRQAAWERFLEVGEEGLQAVKEQTERSLAALRMTHFLRAEGDPPPAGSAPLAWLRST
jgi:biotin operon repressor